MANELGEALGALLKTDERLVAKDGSLLKNKVQELAGGDDSQLLSLLYSDSEVREHFFKKVAEFTVFQKDKFLQFSNAKEWLPDSYTAFKNKIGLATNGQLLSESDNVVIDWAFKDCVLEAGMKEEEANRKEVFYNEILAPNEVNRLLEPKAFSKAVRYSSAGEAPVKTLKMGDNGVPVENLLIRGNNLLALSSLKEIYAKRVRFIYIDPPYNTDSDMLYNDRFRNSTWLTFIKNRLEMAKKLLTDDGLIAVQIDNRMFAHLKILMDEIFGADNLQAVINIKVKESGGVGNDEFLIDVMEHVYIYSKTDAVEFDVPKEEELYDASDEDNYTSILDIQDEGEYVRTIEGGSVGEIKVYSHKKWTLKPIPKADRNTNFYLENFNKIMRTTNPQGGLMKRILPNFPKGKDEVFSIEYAPVRGKNKGKVVREQILGRGLVLWLKTTANADVATITKLKRPTNAWVDENLYQGIANEGSVSLQRGKKPEKLIQRILSLHAKPGDLVLDFFLGSGTTAAVAHKLGMHYIGIEQLHYGENDSTQRLKNVIAGDTTGISKAVGWKGGGEFVYLELAVRNPKILTAIEKATTVKQLVDVWAELVESPYLSYKIDTDSVTKNIEEFKKLELKYAKAFLIEAIDKNSIYVNFSELDDKTNGLSKDDIAVTKSFYGIE
jgi:adenine-specific DNA-methyltransferase